MSFCNSSAFVQSVRNASAGALPSLESKLNKDRIFLFHGC